VVVVGGEEAAAVVVEEEVPVQEEAAVQAQAAAEVVVRVAASDLDLPVRRAGLPETRSRPAADSASPRAATSGCFLREAVRLARLPQHDARRRRGDERCGSVQAPSVLPERRDATSRPLRCHAGILPECAFRPFQPRVQTRTPSPSSERKQRRRRAIGRILWRCSADTASLLPYPGGWWLRPRSPKAAV
jgi:hypothetical protein